MNDAYDNAHDDKDALKKAKVCHRPWAIMENDDDTFDVCVELDGEGNGWTEIALNVLTREYAEQIVLEHNSHVALVAALRAEKAKVAYLIRYGEERWGDDWWPGDTEHEGSSCLEVDTSAALKAVGHEEN